MSNEYKGEIKRLATQLGFDEIAKSDYTLVGLIKAVAERDAKLADVKHIPVLGMDADKNLSDNSITLHAGRKALEQAGHDLSLALRHPHQQAEVVLAWLHDALRNPFDEVTQEKALSYVCEAAQKLDEVAASKIGGSNNAEY